MCGAASAEITAAARPNKDRRSHQGTTPNRFRSARHAVSSVAGTASDAASARVDGVQHLARSGADGEASEGRGDACDHTDAVCGVVEWFRDVVWVREADTEVQVGRQVAG